MERKVFIILNDGEKMILHQAANIMNTACGLADNNCSECPFSKACENLNHGFNIEDLAEDLLKL
jgi:hypothetical protein